jgi:MoaA/NifB/PqqE/SkfB family radical SAM enzyme
MSIAQRALRHARLSAKAAGLTEIGTPPFLILFINSICNLKCGHCFYWKSLNQRDDLSFEELVALSEDLGPIENLNLSGGEPFMRPEFAEICLQFIRQNGVKQLYVPTNGYYTEKTVAAVQKVLENDDFELLACELSLDGMPEYHNKLRGNPRSFERAMETYEALTEIQKSDSRLRIHAITTVSSANAEDARRLTAYLYERCEQMDHHNLVLIRGERKDESLVLPALDGFVETERYAKRLWADREEGRFGAIVDPMLTWAKVRTAREGRQVVPCKAGILSGVVNANGDVALCETTASHPPVGNLRDKSFRELWNSPEANAQREAIRNRKCSCTSEMFLWPSLTFQPLHLAAAMRGAEVWRKPEPLSDDERVEFELDQYHQPIVDSWRGRAQ